MLVLDLILIFSIGLPGWRLISAEYTFAPQLYELLGLVDALRVRRIREQQLAAIALQERLGATL